MKNSKAVDGDGLPAEILQVDIEVTAKLPQPYITSVWKEERLALPKKKKKNHLPLR